MSMEKEIEIPFGKGTLTFRLCRQNLVGILPSPQVHLEVDEEEEIKRALREPISTVKLSRLAHIIHEEI
jgi:nickel-dependent lactate racemase